MRQTLANQRGVNLISLMIALTIGAFLLAGLFQVWFQTRQTFNAQGQLAQLQDNERMALTIMANTVQTGGYYPVYLNYQVPAPATPYSLLTSFPIIGDYTVAGQSIYGTGTASATGANDTLEVRFVADTNTLDCLGQTETQGSLVVNLYSVVGTNLECTVSVTTLAGATIAPVTLPVVAGVSHLAVRYNTLQTPTPATYEYLNASAVASGVGWNNASTSNSNIQSVQIALTFNNPLSGQPGQPTTLPAISRTVAITVPNPSP
ncbi:pilus assembly protein [Dyella sp. S184]|uniref:PilW family protein n=1 Tax=Dyella sp. S184 TaxID=1641862 RepID=UPI00131C9EB9|nr:pilus assembly protein [Dyella sp. S184]